MAEVNGGRPLPWHDTPTCTEPDCSGPMVPVREMANGYGGEKGARIACAACGHGIVGADADVARAERSAAAFRAYDRGEVHPDRGCARCNAALPLDRVRLCAACVDADMRARQFTLFEESRHA